MNCIEFKQRLDDYLDGELPAAEATAAAAHRRSCAHCDGLAGAEERLRQALRSLPAPAARPGFAQQALRNARGHHHRPRQRAFLAGFGSAAAAALVLWLAVLVPGRTPDAPAAEVALALEQAKSVNLVFNATTDVDDVLLEITLPSGFEIAGYAGESTLAWRTDIVKGRNILTLPVVARRPVQGELLARIRFGGREKSLRVRLDAADPRALNLGGGPATV